MVSVGDVKGGDVVEFRFDGGDCHIVADNPECVLNADLCATT